MSVSGDWRLDLRFLMGEASHSLHLEQDGDGVSGRYRSQYGEQDISGSLSADGSVRLRTWVHYQACGAGYTFTGRIDGDRMEGEVDLGEYWRGNWSAERL
jgi:L-seryl-tRNA(Ser) seleniumtransferase